MSEKGLKYDSEKVRPSLLFGSLNKAVAGVLEVLEYGARKYSPDNWKKIEPSRYKDALARHYLAIMAGEQLDSESGLPHIDHLICSALFISEMQKHETRGQSLLGSEDIRRDSKSGLLYPKAPKG